MNVPTGEITDRGGIVVQGPVTAAVEAAELAVADADPGEAVSLTPEQLRGQGWRLVQNLADALPDDVTRFARRSLAQDRPDQALPALVFACIHQGTILSTVEHAVLAECLFAVADDISVLDHLSVGDVGRPVLFEFTDLPQSSADLPDGVLPSDPQGDGDDASTAADGAVAIDQAVATRFGTRTAALGVWRAWRYPVTGSAWPRPTPVYLVEARDETSALELATAFYGGQEGPSPAGEPIIEVYPTGSELPPLHRAVQFAGELVFAAAPPPEFSLADVFDGEPGAGGLPQNTSHVSSGEAERLIAYLLSGTPMLVADTQGEDVLDPRRGPVVPLHLRTDGTWVWSEASAYYLREHLIGPPLAFHAYLRSVPETARRVDDVTLHQAVTWLQSS